MEDKVKDIQQRLRARLSSRFSMGEAALKMPLVSFEPVVGPPSGAESLIPNLVAELKRRGYKVATVKMPAPHDQVAAPDEETTPDAALKVVGGRMVLERNLGPDPSMDEILAQVGEGYDVILGEGFGYARVPKFLVTEKPTEGFNLGLPNIIGYVSDRDEHARIPQFTALDSAGLADRIEEVILGKAPASAGAADAAVAAAADVSADAVSCQPSAVDPI